MAQLTTDERKTLLAIARESIRHKLKKTKSPIFEHSCTITERLKEPCGAFVTLNTGGKLRGCIGYVQAEAPLHETVGSAAVAAATGDYRFDAVTLSELASLSIEISVLSPLREVGDVAEIEVGRHGLLVELANQRGLLLPQVAVEHEWDRKMFLEQTCYKAGLKALDWQNPAAKIFIFDAEIFGEE